MTNNFKLIYILPNLFTAGSIFLGFLSVVASLDGEFTKAAWLIFLSLVFDGLDGRVARLTNTTSKFGVEFDSLADVVAFGLAPAMLLFTYIGDDYGRFGVVVSALFVIFGAIRLARFNVSAGDEEPGVFIGLPIPTAAVFISIWVLFLEKYVHLRAFEAVLLVMALLVAFLMVSNFRYPSFKKMHLPKNAAFKILVFITMVLALAYIFPIETFTVFISGYICYGLCRGIYTIFLIKKENL